MGVMPPERINLEKSNEKEIYVVCSHFHLKTTIFERNKQEKSIHEIVITKKGCLHTCTAQGKKGKLACPVAPGGKGIKTYFEYYAKATGAKKKPTTKKKTEGKNRGKKGKDEGTKGSPE